MTNCSTRPCLYRRTRARPFRSLNTLSANPNPPNRFLKKTEPTARRTASPFTRFQSMERWTKKAKRFATKSRKLPLRPDKKERRPVLFYERRRRKISTNQNWFVNQNGWTHPRRWPNELRCRFLFSKAHLCLETPAQTGLLPFGRKVSGGSLCAACARV